MNTKSLVLAASFLLLGSALAQAQFKSQVEQESRVSEGLMSQSAPGP